MEKSQGRKMFIKCYKGKVLGCGWWVSHGSQLQVFKMEMERARNLIVFWHKGITLFLRSCWVLVWGHVTQATGLSLEIQEHWFYYVVCLSVLNLFVTICQLLWTHIIWIWTIWINLFHERNLRHRESCAPRAFCSLYVWFFPSWTWFWGHKVNTSL